MTEREKMLKGEWYDANFDFELIEERSMAEQLCYDYNTARPGSDKQRAILCDLLGAELPDGLTILAPVYFDYGKRTAKAHLLITAVILWTATQSILATMSL